MTVSEYILANFDKSVIERKEDIGDKIGFPYPATCPCAVGGHFNDFFYLNDYYSYN